METIKKILIPIDFSDYSKAALNYAVNFAKVFNSKLEMFIRFFASSSEIGSFSSTLFWQWKTNSESLFIIFSHKKG